MDIKATDIVFDVDGVCHYCIMFLKMMEEAKAKIIDLQPHRNDHISTIKASGKGKNYDCVVGVSGG